MSSLSVVLQSGSLLLGERLEAMLILSAPALTIRTSRQQAALPHGAPAE